MTQPIPPENLPPKGGKYSQAAAAKEAAVAAAAAPRKGFPYQAATAAFWAPVAMLVFGCVASFAINSTTATDPSMRNVAGIVVGIVSLLLLLTSLVGGTIALASVRRLGGKGLIVRSVVGMLLSLLVLGFGVYSAYEQKTRPQRIVMTVTEHVTGKWQTVVGSGANVVRGKMVLDADGTGSWTMENAQGKLEKSLRWQVALKNVNTRPILVLRFDQPIETPAHIEGIRWEIVQMSDTMLSLEGSDGKGGVTPETYTRMP